VKTTVTATKVASKLKILKQSKQEGEEITNLFPRKLRCYTESQKKQGILTFEHSQANFLFMQNA
jgi:hypothetical protein